MPYHKKNNFKVSSFLSLTTANIYWTLLSSLEMLTRRKNKSIKQAKILYKTSKSRKRCQITIRRKSWITCVISLILIWVVSNYRHGLKAGTYFGFLESIWRKSILKMMVQLQNVFGFSTILLFFKKKSRQTIKEYLW